MRKFPFPFKYPLWVRLHTLSSPTLSSFSTLTWEIQHSVYKLLWAESRSRNHRILKQRAQRADREHTVCVSCYTYWIQTDRLIIIAFLRQGFINVNDDCTVCELYTNSVNLYLCIYKILYNCINNIHFWLHCIKVSHSHKMTLLSL